MEKLEDIEKREKRIQKLIEDMQTSIAMLQIAHLRNKEDAKNIRKKLRELRNLAQELEKEEE